MEITFSQMLEKEKQTIKNEQTIMRAVLQKDYPALYEGLQQVRSRFLIDQTHRLCEAAIHSGCDAKAFDAILYHSAHLLQEVADYGSANNYLLPTGDRKTGGLVQEAAFHDNCDILQYLLDHGCSPNSCSEKDCSPLEAALWGNAINCVTLLEQRDDVDFTITENILKIWGSMGQSPAQDACLGVIAGRLLGEGKGIYYPRIPQLPGLHVRHAAEHQNWPLVRLLCRQGPISAEQGKEVLNRYMLHREVLNVPECSLLLDALFAACPGLLRCTYPRFVLTLCVLCSAEDKNPLLQHWLDQMPGRQITLCGRRLAEAHYDLAGSLHRWNQRMGPRWKPVLQRANGLPTCSVTMPTDDSIRILFDTCEIRGKAPAGDVSPLARIVLHTASPSLLAELLESGKLFPEEDWEALLQYCKFSLYAHRQEKRAVLLAYYKKDVDYEL